MKPNIKVKLVIRRDMESIVDGGYGGKTRVKSRDMESIVDGSYGGKQELKEFLELCARVS